MSPRVCFFNIRIRVEPARFPARIIVAYTYGRCKAIVFFSFSITIVVCVENGARYDAIQRRGLGRGGKSMYAKRRVRIRIKTWIFEKNCPELEHIFLQLRVENTLVIGKFTWISFMPSENEYADWEALTHQYGYWKSVDFNNTWTINDIFIADLSIWLLISFFI